MVVPEVRQALSRASSLWCCCVWAGEVGYPGGIFNPLGFSTDFTTKEKEIANGKPAVQYTHALVLLGAPRPQALPGCLELINFMGLYNTYSMLMQSRETCGGSLGGKSDQFGSLQVPSDLQISSFR